MTDGRITRLEDAARAEQLPGRFWKKVDRSAGPDGCWPWTGASVVRGYGTISITCGRSGAPRKYLATHVAWLLTHGVMPAPGLHACHRCDNPRCVNPAHLFLGTHTENMQDASHKGRKRGRGAGPGERNGRARLGAQDVLWIRSSSLTDVEMAARLGVNVSTVRLARIGGTWRHLPLPSAA